MALGNFSSNTALNLIPPGSVGPVPALSGASMLYEDLNVSTGGVARGTLIGTTFTTVYNFSGSGLIFGFTLAMNNISNLLGSTGWFVRFLIDGQDKFVGSAGLSIGDCISNSIYSLQINATNDQVESFCGLIILAGTDGTFRWTGPNGYPVAFSTSLQIQVRKAGTAQIFNGGLVLRS